MGNESNSESPKLVVPLETWAVELVQRVVAEHTDKCPVRARVEKLEIKLSSFIAFMLGSGALGGTAGAILVKIFMG